jgi:hypothetical protein
VRAEDDHDVQRRYAAALSAEIGWRPVAGEFTLLAVNVEDVTYSGGSGSYNWKVTVRSCAIGRPAPCSSRFSIT